MPAVRAGQCPCVMGVNQELHKSAQKSQTRSAPAPLVPVRIFNNIEMRNIMELNLDSGANLFAMPELRSKHPSPASACVHGKVRRLLLRLRLGLELLGCEAQ